MNEIKLLLKELDLYIDKCLNDINKTKKNSYEIIISNEKKNNSIDKLFIDPKTKTSKEVGQTIYEKIYTLDKENNNIVIHNNHEKISTTELMEGLILTRYVFEIKKEKTKLGNIFIKMTDKELEDFKNINVENIKSILMCRIFSLLPTNILNVNEYVKIITELFENTNVTVKQLDVKKNNFSLLQAVGGASQHQPQMILLKLGNNPKSALVGKGVMYDTGGLSLKPTKSMDTMYYDMTGSALTLCAFYRLRNERNINFYGILALAENSIGSKAYRPGDIIKARGGKTVEIVNTDAEGRLCLADGAHYASEELACQNIICIGTLTGAVIVALGNEYAGLVSDNENLSKKLIESWKSSGDKLFALPADDVYVDYLKKATKRADMGNCSSYHASTIYAWLFIRELCKKGINYAGIDVAGYLEKNLYSRNCISHCHCVLSLAKTIKTLS